MLEWIRSTDTHPTAAQVHDALAGDIPNLSLGTVYRNLQVLVDQALVTPVAVSGGPARYDGNTEPHHHFVCDRCGSIADVEMPEPRGLRKRLRDRHHLEATRVSIDFHGVCRACESR